MYEAGRYQQPQPDYVSQSADLYRTAERLVKEYTELEQKVTRATNAALTQQNYDSERQLNILMDAQQNLNGIISLLRPVMVVKTVEADEVSDTITVKMVQDTFYNFIPRAIGKAVKEGLIVKKEYFDDSDGQLYTSSAALTLIKVIQNSKHTNNGILLINGKVANEKNCPAEYLELMKMLMASKNKILALSKEELILVKKYLINFESERKNISPDLNKLIGTFYMVGMKTSQLPSFKEKANGALYITKTIV